MHKIPARSFHMKIKRLRLAVSTLLLLGLLLLIPLVGAQSIQPEVIVTPDNLTRISWGAVIAGSLLAFILQVTFNLLGIALGITTLHVTDKEPGASTVGIGTIIWVALSMILSYFIGGWVAAYFAGIPDEADGMLHGLMVWASVTTFSILLLTTNLGRIVGGVSSLIGNSLNMMGSAVGTTASAGASVAQGAGSLTASTISALMSGVATTAQMTAHGASSAGQTAIDQSPDVQDALERQNLTYDRIKYEIKQAMRAGDLPPERVEAQAKASAQDLKEAVKEAAQHPEDADHILELALRGVFRRGESVVSDKDRETMLKVMADRTNMSEADARQALQEWETEYTQAKSQAQEARMKAQEKAEELRAQSEEKLHEMQKRMNEEMHKREAQAKDIAHDVKEEAEDMAEKAGSALVKLAGAVVAALIVGAIASGFGGSMGTPEDIPVTEVDVSYKMPSTDFASTEIFFLEN